MLTCDLQVLIEAALSTSRPRLSSSRTSCIECVARDDGTRVGCDISKDRQWLSLQTLHQSHGVDVSA